MLSRRFGSGGDQTSSWSASSSLVWFFIDWILLYPGSRVFRLDEGEWLHSHWMRWRGCLSVKADRSGSPIWVKSLYEDSFELGSSLHIPTNCAISFYFPPLHPFFFFFLLVPRCWFILYFLLWSPRTCAIDRNRLDHGNPENNSQIHGFQMWYEIHPPNRSGILHLKVNE